jgi:hypothetical protein
VEYVTCDRADLVLALEAARAELDDRAAIHRTVTRSLGD